MKKFIVVMFLLLIYSISFAQIPQTMSYQGVLTSIDDTPIPDGMITLNFTLYDSAENGDSLWQETQDVMITKGIFNVILGSNNPLNLPFDKQYWLGVSIGNGEELTPRTALTASPYSLNSHSTIAETEPGQGLTIRNFEGEVTHHFKPNGDVIHTGDGTFTGGIVAGDSTIHPDTTFISDTLNRNQDIVSLKKNSVLEEGQVFRTDEPGVGGFGKGRVGFIGRGTTHGVWGTSDHYGVGGYSSLGYGVSGFGVIAGLEAFRSKLKVDVVPTKELDNYLVWDPEDHIVKQRNLPPGGSFNGILQDKPLIVKNGEEVVFLVDTNGNSYHKGVEEFKDTIVTTSSIKIKDEEDTNNEISIKDKRGNAVAVSRHGFVLVTDSPSEKAIVIDKDGIQTTGDGKIGGGLHIESTKISETEDYESAIMCEMKQMLAVPINSTKSISNNTELKRYGLVVYDPDISGNTDGVYSEVRGSGSAVTALKTKEPAGSAPFFKKGIKDINQPLLPEDLSNANNVVQQSGGYSIWGMTDVDDATAVLGQNTSATSNSVGVWGYTTGPGYSVVGQISNELNSSPAVWGSTNGTGFGVAATTIGTGTAFVADHQGTSGNIAEFRNNNSNVARIDKTGKGFFNGGTQTGGADIAEVFEVEGTAKDYEPGDVLIISTHNDRTVMKSYEPYSRLVVGVYATKPGVLLTERDMDDNFENTVPMGVIGIIPTKVCGENGSISRGDLLVTSSLPGYAMRGSDHEKLTGAVLGKALENFDGTGTGIIKVLVNTK
jgi:hypothetical protein